MFRVQEKQPREIYHDGVGLTASEEEAKNQRPPGVYKCPECRDTTIIWRTTVDKYKVRCAKCSSDMVRVTPMPVPVLPPVATVTPVVVSAAYAGELGLHMLKSPSERSAHNLRQVKLAKVKATELASGRKTRDRRQVELARAKSVELASKSELDELTEQYAINPAAAAKKNELDVLAEIYEKDPQRAQLEAARAGVPLRAVAFHYGKKSSLTGLQLGVAHGQAEAAGTRGAPGALKLWLMQKLHGGSYVIGRQKGLGGKHGGTKSVASIIDELPAFLKGVAGGQTS